MVRMTRARGATVMRCLALPMVVALVLLASPASAQEKAPKPSRPEIARLVWATLIAIDHGNRTGNYSVVRDLGSPAFRVANDPARLAGIFAGLREPDIGLGRAVLYAPEYAEPPHVQENGMLRVKGVIPMRPEGVLFDMLFQHVDGELRLFGIGIAPEEPKAIEDVRPAPPAKP